MGILDFLFQGKPPESVTSYGETTQDLPTWYSDYTQGLISRANAIAAEPYQPYSMPRIAPLDIAQQEAYSAARGLESQYAPTMNAAIYAATQGGTGSALQAAQPFFNQAQTYNPMQAAQPLLTEATGLVRQQVGDTAGLAQPFLNLAAQQTQQAGAGTAGLASPYMQQASQLSTQGAQTGLGGIEAYMNPYQDQVVNRLGELAQRNLRENIMPEIQDRAIAAGQFGGSRQGEAIGRALRDVQESTLAAQSQALQSGYSQAAQQQATDRARQLQAAQQQAGFGAQEAQLSAADLQRLMSAAGQQAALGQSTAGLSAADLQRLLQAGGQQAALGQSLAGLTGADLARYGQAGSQIGALGQLQGSLAGQTGAQAIQVGQQTGALAGQDLTRQLQAAQQLGALGQQQQSMGLQNIGALEGAGAMQQQQQQRSLDQAYADFLSQREYDRQNIAFLNAAIRGLEIPTSTSTQSTGPASVYQPSPLSQLAQAGATVMGINKLFPGT
jgi:hypothetical protein